jgi:hypothetical protein
MHFVRRQTAAGLELIDPLARDLTRAARACRGEASDVTHFLSLAAVFPPTLGGSAVFRADLSAAYASLLDPRDEARR